jgi:hypothetical protein
MVLSRLLLLMILGAAAVSVYLLLVDGTLGLYEIESRMFALPFG